MWMQKYKKISRFLTFKRFLYQTEEYFYYYFEKTNRNYTNILFFFPTKLLQKREMRKDIVIELSYKGFSRASDYS